MATQPEFMQVGNPAAPFLNAFALGAEINRRNQALKEQMLKMETQNLFQQERLSQAAENMHSLILSRDIMNSQREANMAFKTQAVNEATGINNKATDFISGASRIKGPNGKPAVNGTPEYLAGLTTMWDSPEYAGLRNSKQGQQLYNTYLQNYKTAAKSLADSGAGLIGQYARLKTDVLGSPKAAFDDTKFAPSKDHPGYLYRIYDVKNGVTLDPHSKTAEEVNAPGSGLTYKYAAAKDVQTLKKLKDALPDVALGITGNPDFDAARAAKADEAAANEPQPFPADPSQATPGVYQTPKGPLRWTGTGFVPP